MTPPSPSEQSQPARVGTLSGRIDRLADLVLMGQLVAIAALLACYKVTDTDVWWHLRGGQWIAEHARPPSFDPFTFGSADRVWVDLHWLFEVVLAGVFRAGGMTGVVLLTVAAAAGAVATGVCATVGTRGAALTTACCAAPLVLIGYRLDPRPEMFSLLLLAAFMAVLTRAAKRPRWLWVLPALQVLWVNSHGLFVLGPIVFGLFGIGQAIQDKVARARGREAGERHPGFWRNAGLALPAVVVACLVNPYLLDGALLPIKLFPKIADPANDYKTYIDEFFSVFEYARRSPEFAAEHRIHYRALYLVMLSVPTTFIFPALWRAWWSGRVKGGKRIARDAGRVNRSTCNEWFVAFAATLSLLLAGAMTVPVPVEPRWLATLGGWLPLLALALSATAALWLARSSLTAGALALSSGCALALGMHLFAAATSGASATADGPRNAFLLMATTSVAACLVVWHGGNVFRLLLSVSFIYLGLQAVRNLNLLGLAAAVIMSLNMTEWVAESLTERIPKQYDRAVAAFLRLIMMAFLGAWLAAIPTGRYHRWTGDRREFGLGEARLEFAHDAARFAGRDGLPEHALAYDLGLAALYVFHNGPDKKVYMDPRLELPSEETFRTYVEIDDSLHGRNDRWSDEIARLGNPLLLLDHRGHSRGEAAVFARDDWRCIYYDAQAAAFVSRRQGVSDEAFPTINFARRHFFAKSALIEDSKRDLLEAAALVQLGSDLCPQPAATWKWRIPSQWLALEMLAGPAGCAAAPEQLWSLRGRGYWNTVPKFSEAPPMPSQEWRNVNGLRWGQLTWCFQRAREAAPDRPAPLRYLYDSFRARRMFDAQAVAGRQLIELGSATSRHRAETTTLEGAMQGLATLRDAPGEVSADVVVALIERGYAATATELVEARSLDVTHWQWRDVDRLAAAWMHLGHPEQARALWQNFASPPAETTRLSRIADTYWVELDNRQAEELYRAALSADPTHSDSLWGLTALLAERGEWAEAHDVGRVAVHAQLSPDAETELKAMVAMIDSAAGDRDQRGEP